MHAVGVFNVPCGGGGKRMLCVFVSGSFDCQHTDLCLCGVQEVKKSQSRGGVSVEDRMP